MTTLSENIVFAVTRLHDLQHVRKLNCCNFQLEDVSILRKMPNVKTLLLPMNKIKNLSDFAFCEQIEELSLRNNEINDINEIFYLTNLKNLKKLWLSENPCANKPNYRYTVIKALPHLELLDKIEIETDELRRSKELGTSVYDPEDEEREEYTINNYDQNEYIEQEVYIQSNEEQPVSNDYDSYEAKKNNLKISSNNDYCQKQATVQKRNSITSNSENYILQENLSLSNSSLKNKSLNNSQNNHHNQSLNSNKNLKMLSKGGKNRNANLLSAMLCLIKELDFASLEVVETAVHCRMEELEE